MRGAVGRGVAFEEYETPKTVDFVAQIGPGSRRLVQGSLRQRAGPARRTRAGVGADRPSSVISRQTVEPTRISSFTKRVAAPTTSGDEYSPLKPGVNAPYGGIRCAGPSERRSDAFAAAGALIDPVVLVILLWTAGLRLLLVRSPEPILLGSLASPSRPS